MNKEHVGILTLEQYHLLVSTRTNKPYIDDNGRCYLFYLKSDAEKFINDMSDIKIDNARLFGKQNIAEFYAYGIREIRIKQKGGNIAIIPIEKGDVRKDYTNHLASFSVTMLKQTSKKKYLTALKGAVFLAPILIDPRAEKRYPEMHYSYATSDGNDRYYCLFTTLKEFNSWNKEQAQDWKPVEMPLYKVGRIRADKPIIINPLTDGIIITDKQIQEVLRG